MVSACPSGYEVPYCVKADMVWVLRLENWSMPSAPIGWFMFCCMLLKSMVSPKLLADVKCGNCCCAPRFGDRCGLAAGLICDMI